MTRVALSKTSTVTLSTPEERQWAEEWLRVRTNLSDKSYWTESRLKEREETLKRLDSPEVRWVTCPSTVTLDDQKE
jgi:hypothetical protein